MNFRMIEPVRASVTVGRPAEEAFQLFVGGLSRWWPLAYTYAEGDLEAAEIEPHAGGEWFEVAKGGERTSWGEVRAFEPPRRLVLSFAVSPQRAPEPPERASEVEIVFGPDGNGGTRLDLEHRNFEQHGDGAMQLRDGMASRQGWSLILAEFARWAKP